MLPIEKVIEVIMNPKLLLVDLENRQKFDLSLLDESYSAIIFVGAQQNPPKAALKQATSHRFQRVTFQKIDGAGKNALDFHIAFQLGRTYETAPLTQCFILSGDRGFDPLVTHLNKLGLKCQRGGSLNELFSDAASAAASKAKLSAVVCPRCRMSSTIEQHGGRWCTNCGCFAAPPDPSLLPSNQPWFRRAREDQYLPVARENRINTVCGWCNRRGDMSGVSMTMGSGCAGTAFQRTSTDKSRPNGSTN